MRSSRSWTQTSRIRVRTVPTTVSDVRLRSDATLGPAETYAACGDEPRCSRLRDRASTVVRPRWQDPATVPNRSRGLSSARRVAIKSAWRSTSLDTLC